MDSKDNESKQEWTNKKVDKFVVVNKVLGQGQFGKVYRGFFQENEKKAVACKAIDLKKVQNSDKMLELIKREISNLQKIKNPHIVNLHDVARTTNNLYMFLEYCGDGDLKEYLATKEGKHLSEAESIYFFQHVVEAFKELYAKKIIHRDIKPANIMLNDGLAKIADFGFSRILEIGMEEPTFLSRLGSPLYMGPQILEGTKFSSKCDVWSVGIVFFEMLYGKTPWTGENQVKLLQNIQKQPLSFPSSPYRSDKVKNILKEMLVYEEDKRMSWEQVFAHEFFKNLEYDPQAQLHQLQSDMKEGFDKNLNLNINYIQKNLVAGYLNRQTSQGSQRIQEQNNIDQQQQESEFTNDDLMTSKVLQNEDKLHKNILKVNEYILYERNIAFFFNYVIQKIINLMNKGVYTQVSKDLYFRIIYSISKNQHYNLDRISKIMNDSKTQSDIDEKLWSKYKESNPYKKAKALIETDDEQCQIFYKQISNKCSELIKFMFSKEQMSEDKKQKLTEFQIILDDDPNNQQKIMGEFKKIYKQTISEFFSAVKPVVMDKKDIKDLLEVVNYLFVCKNPYEEFKNTAFDFSKFYEENRNSPEDNLASIVKQKYSSE